MQKFTESPRLHAGGLSARKIATRRGVGQSTASEYPKRIERAALTPDAPECYPLSMTLSDRQLARQAQVFRNWAMAERANSLALPVFG